MPTVLGIDSSTQSTKAVLCDLETGTPIAHSSAAHPATSPPISEQDPDAWWRALCTALEELGPRTDNVVALAVAGQQHGLVLLDDDDAVIRPAKLWNDTTSAPQAAALVDALGAPEWAARCGSVPVAAFTISKLAWIAEHEPDTLRRVRRVMLPHDYLTWRLTGAHVTDRGDASGTGWFDPAADVYRDDLLSLVVDSPDDFRAALPVVLGPGAAAGPPGPAGLELGLPPGAIVAAGTGDNMAAALGLGLGPGDLAMSLGTSGTIYAVSPEPTADPEGLVSGFADAAGRYLPLVCTLNATRVTDTVAAWLGTDAAGLDELAGRAEPGFGGVVLVPYFDGERTPNLPASSGRFHGLRTTTTREQLARAAHDGVLCGLFAGRDALHAAGVATGRIHLVGGGARSRTYRRRCATLAGASISVPREGEMVALGAAVQAAAVHRSTSTDVIADDWGLGGGEVVEPDEDGHAEEIRGAYEAAAREVAATA